MDLPGCADASQELFPGGRWEVERGGLRLPDLVWPTLLWGLRAITECPFMCFYWGVSRTESKGAAFRLIGQPRVRGGCRVGSTWELVGRPPLRLSREGMVAWSHSNTYNTGCIISRFYDSTFVG